MMSAVAAMKKIEELPEDECSLFILCPGLGDDETKYDPKDKASLERAAKKFEGATRGERRMAGISIGKDNQPKHTDKFDPEAKGHVVVPPIAGG
jgi:hypothetical protein